MRNRELRRLITLVILLLSTVFIVIFITNNILFNQYKRTIVENNAFIISSIIEEYPDLKSELIDILLKLPSNLKQGIELLKTYGLDDIRNLDHLVSLQQLQKEMSRYNYLLVGSLISLIIIIFGIFIYIIYSRLRKINLHISKILNHEDPINIGSYEEGDISNLKTEINKVMLVLKEQRDLSKKDKLYLGEALSDISHQLKTPLTSLYVINDVLQNESLETKDRQEFLLQSKKQLERIEWLVESLLKLSMLDSGTIVLKSEPIIVSELFEDVISDLSIPLEIKNQTIQMGGDLSITVSIDYRWMVEAISNIVKNAHEHTAQGGQIQISCEDNPLYTEIKIVDSGEGIPKSEIASIFKRFYKGPNSDKNSIGIGLHLAKTIVEKQGGDIEVFSEMGVGTTFVIKLYKNILK